VGSLLIVALSHCVLYSQGLSISAENCSTLMCRPGRECRQTTGEAPHCACVIKCPDHWKPVCGSDGISYDSHCSLHRAACVSGTPISQIHSGFCRKDKSPEREELESWRTEQTPSPPQSAPAACFETDRNQFRDFLMSWLQLQAKKQVWYSPEMTYKEELIGHFFSLDQNRDDFLDSEEMLEGLNSNWTEVSGRILTGDLRQLCLDSLVEEGDKNSDWRLSLKEFLALLSPQFKMSHKLCSLSNKTYKDGSTTMLECNSCVCACGKWICSSSTCQQTTTGNRNIRNENTTNLILEDDEYNYIDDNYDEDDYDDSEEESTDEYNNPEEDPDVQDISWF